MESGEYIEYFSKIHDQIKEVIESRQSLKAMTLLEKCQRAAGEWGNEIERKEGKESEAVLILLDYCELVYLINEQLWHGERVNPGKVHRYLNKSLGLMKREVKDTSENQNVRC